MTHVPVHSGPLPVQLLFLVREHRDGRRRFLEFSLGEVSLGGRQEFLSLRWAVLVERRLPATAPTPKCRPGRTRALLLQNYYHDDLAMEECGQWKGSKGKNAEGHREPSKRSSSLQTGKTVKMRIQFS